ncbi:MAG TPA: S-adenosylmethionine:tRNA ribosyltransferase-isomerase [Fibrobacteria bacterium]|nr:S-adenosylmethionine:tRNA ribosyltransferase-isomerase [Fibrobacteria bacterium]
MVVQAPFRFELPDDLSAREPPEKRGLSRDGVRLLAADRRTGALTHTRFNRIADFLRPGDCLVFNASRTLPAVLQALAERADGRGSGEGHRLQMRLARRWEDGVWSVLALSGNDEPWQGDLLGSRLILAAGGPAGVDLSAEVLGRDPWVDRLWKIRFSQVGPRLMESLSRLGDPVRYWYASAPWDLEYYQTVYAREPGSVEMPSAGRAFTWKLLMDLRRKGIGTAFLVLHAGLSSYMDEEFDAGHPASVEPFHLDGPAAERINAAKARGGRVIAVGTTVVRALESVADAQGRVRAEAGQTRLRITPGYRLKAADGLLTGFHEPTASHLDLLTAFLPPERLRPVYEAALRGKYLWHEFGDANLIL